MATVTNIVLGLLLAGLIMTGVMRLPDSVRGEWAVIPVLLLSFGLVFFLRRRKS